MSLYQARKEYWTRVGVPDPGFKAMQECLAAKSNPKGLTLTEAQIFSIIFLRNEDIAKVLGKPIRTIEKHIEFILNKLKVETRTSAALEGLNLGYSIDWKLMDCIWMFYMDDIFALKPSKRAIRQENCEFCNRNLPQNRLKYCSTICKTELHNRNRRLKRELSSI